MTGVYSAFRILMDLDVQVHVISNDNDLFWMVPSASDNVFTLMHIGGVCKFNRVKAPQSDTSLSYSTTHKFIGGRKKVILIPGELTVASINGLIHGTFTVFSENGTSVEVTAKDGYITAVALH